MGPDFTLRLWAVKMDGSGSRLLVDRTTWSASDLSGDGTKLLWTYNYPNTGWGPIVVTDATGANAKVLSVCPSFWGRLRWSPSGTRLLSFEGPIHAGFSAALYVMDHDGRNSRMLGAGEAAFWSPSEDWLVVNNWNQNELWLLNVASESRTRILHDMVTLTPTWSSRGETIAFSDRSAILLVESDGSGLRKIADGGAVLDWSPDGNRIFFAASSGDIWSVAVDGSEARNLTNGSAR
jgi:Tol biopolymer transport system component